MSLERVIKALIGLGLTRLDAEVYVYLAKKGPQTVVDLAKALNFSRKKIYDSLKKLQKKGIVTVNLEDCTVFYALPFEKALELLIKTEKQQTQLMQETKEVLLSTWRSTVKKDS